MPKIIQISACASETEETVYGLDAEGLLYYWGSQRVEQIGGQSKSVYGWKLLKDEINNK